MSKEETGSYGERISLRLLTHDDTDLIVAWRNQDAVRKNFIYQELFTRQGHESWIRNMIETGRVIQTVICDLAGDRPLGSVYIRDIDRQHTKAEYGIFIGCCATALRKRGCTEFICGPFRTMGGPSEAMKRQGSCGRLVCGMMCALTGNTVILSGWRR